MSPGLAEKTASSNSETMLPRPNHPRSPPVDFDGAKQTDEAAYARFFHEWSERDIVDMIRRDRNHPSVVMWSIGNEIPEQHEPQGPEMAQRLVEVYDSEVPLDEKELVTELFNQTSITELLGDHEMIMDGDEYFI